MKPTPSEKAGSSQMVSSQTKGVLVNADGSVDVYIHLKAPAGKKLNWVRPFRAGNTLLGRYGSLVAWLNKTWCSNEITLVT